MSSVAFVFVIIFYSHYFAYYYKTLWTYALIMLLV